MVTTRNQKTWLPYEPPKDCSMGLCSIYCHRWCYTFFSPPPPILLSDESSRSTTFSPLVIAVVGVLATAFLFVSFYAIVSKYCCTSESLRRQQHRSDADDHELADDLGQSSRGDPWHVSPTHGLDQALINKITLCKYKRGDVLVEGTDCSICLGEFREDDSLRLLPKCSHAFHLPCIDTWLKSHSNCPLCRADIVVTDAEQPPAPPAPVDIPQVEDIQHSDEMGPLREDSAVVGGEEENQLENKIEVSPQTHGNLEGMESNAIVEIRDCDFQTLGRSASMGSLHRGGEVSMMDEFVAAKENGVWIGTTSSTGRGGGDLKDNSRNSRPQLVVSTAQMKRSFSSGRFGMSRNGRGRNAILPIVSFRGLAIPRNVLHNNNRSNCISYYCYPG
ncbi:unnamed protein product [Musa hybrid cultivar]